MKRNEVIKEMMKKANDMFKNGWTRDGENELWDIAYDWNRDHDYSEAIFMCEITREDGYDGNGFYIEDDYWVFDND